MQVIAVDLGDYENKLNAMIASGSPPDIFNSYSKPKIKDLVDNKAILQLDPLLEKSGKNISENKGKYLKGIGYIDGKTYAIPNAYGLGNGLAIRQDWLDKLGLKVPTTLDEYENVLKAFVTKDPDGNGKNDTIGLGLSVSIDQTFEHVFAAYGVPLKRGVLVDGKVTPWPLAPVIWMQSNTITSCTRKGCSSLTLQPFQRCRNMKSYGMGRWVPFNLILQVPHKTG